MNHVPILQKKKWKLIKEEGSYKEDVTETEVKPRSEGF